VHRSLASARKHPELVILGVFAVVVAAMIVKYQTRHSAAQAQVQTVAPFTTPTDSPVPALAPAAAPATSDAAVPAPSPTVVVSDLPTWDQQGDPACQMHYSQLPDGMTITRFTLTEPGELITHVSDMAGKLHRNDQQESAGAAAFSYDVPLSQISDMGAIFYPDGGASVMCGITPGANAP
jgi:hypothetical protein